MSENDKDYLVLEWFSWISMESRKSLKHQVILVIFTHPGLPGFLEKCIFCAFPGILVVPDLSFPWCSLKVLEVSMIP